jgi:hypothetical protein
MINAGIAEGVANIKIKLILEFWRHVTLTLYDLTLTQQLDLCM